MEKPPGRTHLSEIGLGGRSPTRRRDSTGDLLHSDQTNLNCKSQGGGPVSCIAAVDAPSRKLQRVNKRSSSIHRSSPDLHQEWVIPRNVIEAAVDFSSVWPSKI